MTTNAQRDDQSRIIRASEVGEFVYCAHAWWLGSVEGKRPDDTGRLEAGWAAHEHHGRRVVTSTALTRLAYLLLLLSGMAGIGWLIGLLIG
jgi:hypothetical protein